MAQNTADAEMEHNVNISMAHDVRGIANLVLKAASEASLPITNMQINKIVYFLHVDYLRYFGRPLVSAKIEAWEHGPVFRELYSEFKKFGDSPITSMATLLSPSSGRREIATTYLEKDEADFVLDGIARYAHMSAGALRAQSHVPGGPWDRVWNHETNTSVTMRITDDSIMDWFDRSQKH